VPDPIAGGTAELRSKIIKISKGNHLLNRLPAAIDHCRQLVMLTGKSLNMTPFVQTTVKEVVYGIST